MNKLLILIALFFLVTRLYQITTIPSSVYWDEASIGYNAYSILKTGQDEWGKSFPIHFRAFGEFKLPVYIYSTVPFVALFGLNEFSVRLPAVLFSLGVVVLTYFLSKEIFKKESSALWSSFLVSISPWFFLFSRTGYEVTAGLFFFMLGLFFLIKTPTKVLFIVGGTVSFIISIYSYNSFRFLIPPLFGLLFLFHLFSSRKNLKNLKLTLLVFIISLGVFVISYYPILKVNLYDTAAIRNSQLRIWGDSKSPFQVAEKFVSNYFSHLSPEFLFTKGDKNLRSQQNGFGQIYFIDVLFFLISLIVLIKKPKSSSELIRFLPLLVVLVSFVPASLTKESPHALRSVAFVPFFYIILGVGVSWFTEKMKFKKMALLVTLVYGIFFANYYYHFLTNFPLQAPKEWQYAYKQIYTQYQNVFPNYDEVLVSDSYGQPYIFALFYMRQDPIQFRSQVKRSLIEDYGFSNVSSIGNLNFVKDKGLEVSNSDQKILAFVSPTTPLPNMKPINKIYFPDGEIAFLVYER